MTEYPDNLTPITGNTPEQQFEQAAVIEAAKPFVSDSLERIEQTENHLNTLHTALQKPDERIAYVANGLRLTLAKLNGRGIEQIFETHQNEPSQAGLLHSERLVLQIGSGKKVHTWNNTHLAEQPRGIVYEKQNGLLFLPLYSTHGFIESKDEIQEKHLPIKRNFPSVLLIGNKTVKAYLKALKDNED